jgi:hypothetical protein
VHDDVQLVQFLLAPNGKLKLVRTCRLSACFIVCCSVCFLHNADNSHPLNALSLYDVQRMISTVWRSCILMRRIRSIVVTETTQVTDPGELLKSTTTCVSLGPLCRLPLLSCANRLFVAHQLHFLSIH